MMNKTKNSKTNTNTNMNTNTSASTRKIFVGNKNDSNIISDILLALKEINILFIENNELNIHENIRDDLKKAIDKIFIMLEHSESNKGKLKNNTRKIIEKNNIHEIKKIAKESASLKLLKKDNSFKDIEIYELIDEDLYNYSITHQAYNDIEFILKIYSSKLLENLEKLSIVSVNDEDKVTTINNIYMNLSSIVSLSVFNLYDIKNRYKEFLLKEKKLKKEDDSLKINKIDTPESSNSLNSGSSLKSLTSLTSSFIYGRKRRSNSQPLVYTNEIDKHHYSNFSRNSSIKDFFASLSPRGHKKKVMPTKKILIEEDNKQLLPKEGNKEGGNISGENKYSRRRSKSNPL